METPKEMRTLWFMTVAFEMKLEDEHSAAGNGDGHSVAATVNGSDGHGHAGVEG